jgi:hypothetical protein
MCEIKTMTAEQVEKMRAGELPDPCVHCDYNETCAGVDFDDLKGE